MGYGLGAALGAKLAHPEKMVVNVAGDGCFRMNMNEIATAVRYNIPIVQLVINNHVLGMVRQWQTLFYGKRYAATVLNDSVDFVKLAEAMGAEGIRVTKKEEIAPALEKAFSLGKPVVIDCIIDSDDKVFPMVPAGAAIEEVFDEDDLEESKK
jgi:acetolactate synthase-1/2/3 large subunit